MVTTLTESAEEGGQVTLMDLFKSDEKFLVRKPSCLSLTDRLLYHAEENVCVHFPFKFIFS